MAKLTRTLKRIQAQPVIQTLIALWLEQLQAFINWSKSIDLNGISVIQDMEGYNLYLIIPLDMEYSLEGNVLRVDSAQLKADGIKVEQSQQDGRTILLVKVTE